MYGTATIGFVVPVYRPELTAFSSLLASLVAQTDPAWECVLVDDGSADRDLSRYLDSVSFDPRFHVVRAERNGGIAAATNLGIEAATAPVLAFVDQDDLIAARTVATLIDQVAARDNVAVAYSDEATIDVAGRVLGPYPKPAYSPIRHLGQHYLAHLIAAKRSVIGELRVRSEYEPAQDVDFVFRLIQRAHEHGKAVVHIPVQLYGWRAAPGSTALNVAEKPGMSDAVLACMTAEADRRGIDASLAIATDVQGRPSTSVHVELAAPDPTEIDLCHLPAELFAAATAADSAPEVVAEVATAVARGDARFVALIPVGLHDAEMVPDWVRVVASEAARDGVAIAGPAVVRHDGSVGSVGRQVVPTLSDTLAGHPFDDGPFGAYLVAREVSAVTPIGAVIDRVALRDKSIDVTIDASKAWAGSLDVVVAHWCQLAERAGLATVWTPRARVSLDVPGSHPAPVETAAAWQRWVDDHGQPDERYAVTGVAAASALAPDRLGRLADPSTAGLVVTLDALFGDVMGEQRRAAWCQHVVNELGHPPLAGVVRDALGDVDPATRPHQVRDVLAEVVGSFDRGVVDAAIVAAWRQLVDDDVVAAMQRASAADIPLRLVAATSLDPLLFTAVGLTDTADVARDRLDVAIDEVAVRGGAVVVAVAAHEVGEDPRVAAALAGQRAAVGEMSAWVVPFTPWPWPPFIEWHAGLPAERSAQTLITLAATWRHAIARQPIPETDPNAQLGVAFAPLVASVASWLHDYARSEGVRHITLTSRLAPLSTMLATVFDAATAAGVATISVADTVGVGRMIGWDADDPETGDGAVLVEPSPKRSADGANDRGDPAAVWAHGQPGDVVVLIERFFSTDPVDAMFPGLSATRRVAAEQAGVLFADAYGAAASEAGFAQPGAAFGIDELTSLGWSAAASVAGSVEPTVRASLGLWYDDRFDGPLPAWSTQGSWLNMPPGVVDGLVVDRVEPLPPTPTTVTLATFVDGNETPAAVVVGPAHWQRPSRLAAEEPEHHRSAHPGASTGAAGTDVVFTVRSAVLHSQQDGLRAVTFRVEEPCLIELVSLRLTATVEGGDERTIELADVVASPPKAADAAVDWVDATPVGALRWIQHEGGQLVVHVRRIGDALFGRGPVDLTVAVEFRQRAVTRQDVAQAERHTPRRRSVFSRLRRR